MGSPGKGAGSKDGGTTVERRLPSPQRLQKSAPPQSALRPKSTGECRGLSAQQRHHDGGAAAANGQEFQDRGATRKPGIQSKGKSQQTLQEADEWALLRARIQAFLLRDWFDVGMGILIVLNSCSIGVEQSLQLNGEDTTAVKAVESFFLVVYIVELWMRIFAFGYKALQQNWVRFDLFLVALGVLTSWILEPAMQNSPSGFAPLMVLRTARLLRLAKTVRLLSRVQEFWMLVRGFMDSARIMLYVFVMLLLILYVFGLVGVELITKHTLNATDAVFAVHAEKYFRTLPDAMLTLVRFACLDNTAEVYKPLVDKDPWLAIYFILIILIVSIVFFHLLGAVVFSITLEQNVIEHDEDRRGQAEEWAEMIQNLKDMFLRLDSDKSGNLSREEVLDIAEEDRKRLCEALAVRTPIQVFNALDIDKSGSVSINEFIDGIWSVALEKSDVELKRMEKQVETMHWRLKETYSLQHELCMSTQKILAGVESLKERSELPDVPESTQKALGMLPTEHQHAAKSAEASAVGCQPLKERSRRVAAASEVPATRELMDRLQRACQEALQAVLEECLLRPALSKSPARRGSSPSARGGREAGSSSRPGTPRTPLKATSSSSFQASETMSGSASSALSRHL